MSTTADATTVGFVDDYAIPNWTISSSGVGGLIDMSGAPSSITLVEPDSGSGGWIEFSIAAAEAGTFAFDWAFGGVDFGFGSAQVRIGSTLTTLADASATSGSFSTAVAFGDLIGFRSTSVDGIFGSTTFTISNLSVPSIAAVPLPAAFPLLVVALGGLSFAARRRRSA
jgi:hypothetical protein